MLEGAMMCYGPCAAGKRAAGMGLFNMHAKASGGCRWMHHMRREAHASAAAAAGGGGGAAAGAQISGRVMQRERRAMQRRHLVSVLRTPIRPKAGGVGPSNAVAAEALLLQCAAIYQDDPVNGYEKP